MKNSLARAGLFALPMLSLLAAAQQQPALSFQGDNGGDHFGAAVSGAGDVNRDGFDDLIVGAPRNDDNGADAGKAVVLSGEDGSELYAFLGAGPGVLYGSSVGAAGDVNGDGYADVIIGIPMDGTAGVGAGAAEIRSGFDGSVIWTLLGSAAGDEFGAAVEGAGDVNADGYDDVIVGAPFSDAGVPDAGAAIVFSGLDGSVLHTLVGTTTGEEYGSSVDGAGDIDGDCHDDLIVGASQATTNGPLSGRIEVVSGQTGSILHAKAGNPDTRLGFAVAGLGDVDGDGTVDFIAGAPTTATNGADSGQAFVYSGATGAVLWTYLGKENGDNLGFSVCGAGDRNGDGFADFVIGIPGLDNGADAQAGAARVYSGATGRVLMTLQSSETGGQLGTSVSGAGDIDGDGFADAIAGGPAALGATGVAVVCAGDPFDDTVDLGKIVKAAATNSQFGTRMKVVGDVNGDGVDDYMVGAPFDLAKFGSASVFSGADHSLIRQHFGSAGFDAWFGNRVGGVGDINGDGFADYAITAWHADIAGADSGYARLYSGVNGNPLIELFGANPGDHLGSCVDKLGDVNGDQVDDYFMGVGKGNNDTGFVDIRSGADHSIIYTVSGVIEGEWFGWSGATVGDIDGDGIADFVIGAMAGQTVPLGTGYAKVFSGANGSVIHTFEGPMVGSRYGWYVAPAGDVNADGVPDIYVGGDGFDLTRGIARVHSGATGAILYSHVGQATGDSLGLGGGAVGDYDGDGFGDYVVGAPLRDTAGLIDNGVAYIYSGQDGSLIDTREGAASDDALGRACIGSLEDSDGDGYPEILIGIPKDNTFGVDLGSVLVVGTTVRDQPGFFDLFGSACPGSNGTLPRLSFSGQPSIGRNFSIDLRSAPPSTTAYIAFNANPASYSLAGLGGAPCFLWALPVFIAPVVTDAAGKVTLPFVMPNEPGFIGGALHVQWLINDSVNALGLIATRGGKINIGNAY